MNPGLFLLLLFSASAIGYEIFLKFKKPPFPLRDREDMTVDQLKITFFDDIELEKSEFEEILTEIGRISDVSPGLIRPSDRFGIELPCQSFLGMNEEDIGLGTAFYHRAKKTGVSTSHENIETVAEYMRHFSKPNLTSKNE